MPNRRFTIKGFAEKHSLELDNKTLSSIGKAVKKKLGSNYVAQKVWEGKNYVNCYDLTHEAVIRDVFDNKLRCNTAKTVMTGYVQVLIHIYHSV